MFCDVVDWLSSDVDAGTLLLDDVDESKIVAGGEDALLLRGAVPAGEEGAAELLVLDSVDSSSLSSLSCDPSGKSLSLLSDVGDTA